MLEVDSKINNNFSKFSKLDYNSNKAYLSNAYGTKPIYFDELKEKENKELKRKKTLKIVAIVGVGTAMLSIIAATIKNKNIGAEQIKKIEELKITDKVSNILSNIINIKDDIWDKFIKKVQNVPVLGWLKKGSDKITNVYKETIRTTLSKKYKKLYMECIKKGASYETLPDFDKWFNSIDKSIYDALHIEGKKVTDGLFKKGIIKRVTDSNIADDKIKDIALKAAEKIPLSGPAEAQEAIEALNKEKEAIVRILIPKLRDISCGSAPTDMLTIIMSAIGLCSATALADDNKERKSIMINLGIPLMVALASTTIGTLKCLSGAKSLLFGLATGNIASRTAKLIDNKINNDENKA